MTEPENTNNPKRPNPSSQEPSPKRPRVRSVSTDSESKSLASESHTSLETSAKELEPEEVILSNIFRTTHVHENYRSTQKRWQDRVSAEQKENQCALKPLSAL